MGRASPTDRGPTVLSPIAVTGPARWRPYRTAEARRRRPHRGLFDSSHASRAGHSARVDPAGHIRPATSGGVVSDLPEKEDEMSDPTTDEPGPEAGAGLVPEAESGREAESGPDTSPEPETSSESGGGTEDDANPLETEAEIAADYLEELLDIADLDGDIDTYIEGDRAHVSIVSDSD